MRWADIRVETTAQAQDAVSNLMIENGCAGVVIEGETPVVVRCYLPVDDRLEQRLQQMQDGIKGLPKFGLDAGPGEITVKHTVEEDWAEAWKSFFHTTRVGKRIVIKPPWEEYVPERKDIVIEIDPGMAFGTGNHETTRLCLQALEKYMKRRSVVVDFGTGSGVLAIAAAKLGATIVIAFDADDIAVHAARANVQRNDMEMVIEVHQAESLKFVTARVDMITANILAKTIIDNAHDLAESLRIGGVLIASGIITERSLDVEQALRNEGFDIAERLTEGEWVALVARKSS